MTKPFIGVANSYTNIVPGHIHLRQIGEAVKEGILAAGGIPFEFSTIAVCDGVAMGHIGMRYSLPSREIIADSVEIMMQAHSLDGLVMISNCDKITPGMLMAAARSQTSPPSWLQAAQWRQDATTAKKSATPACLKQSDKSPQANYPKPNSSNSKPTLAPDAEAAAACSPPTPWHA